MHTFENQPSTPQKPAATTEDADAATLAAQRCITRARAALVMEHPFFGSLALRLRYKADSSCADMWTDGKTLGYNPAFSTALSQNIYRGIQRRKKCRKKDEQAHPEPEKSLYME